MNRIIAFIAFCILFLTVPAFGQKAEDKTTNTFDAELAARLGADDYGMRSYVYVLLKTGPADITDEKKRNEIFRGHFANMGKLAEKGILVAAGPFDDPKKVKRGFYIFNVDNVEDAKKYVESDPGVKSGIFDYELTKLYSSAALMMINEIHGKIQKKKIE
ncbi:MAG: hypothetical protein HKN33_11120 [Pyrinomonadaceae bacterium]|nr:hypothetical protein [Pyrinomonadaceae bacterium]